jgi:hypothetical protein
LHEAHPEQLNPPYRAEPSGYGPGCRDFEIEVAAREAVEIELGEEKMTPQSEYGPEIDGASLRVRAWLKERVNLALKPYEEGPRGNRVIQPNSALVPVKIAAAPRAVCKLCGKPAQARKLCGTHYFRWRYGKPADANSKLPCIPGKPAVNRRDDVTNEQIQAMRDQGLSYAKIGKAVGLHPETIYRRVNGKPGARP